MHPRDIVDTLRRTGGVTAMACGESCRATDPIRLSDYHQRNVSHGVWKLSACVQKRRLDLFDDFTFSFSEPVDGVQYRRKEDRPTFGLATRRHFGSRRLGHPSSHTVGIEARQDRLTPVGLDAGWGCGNNDARAVTSTVAPVGRKPLVAAPGVADIHFHPAEPRTFRLTLATGF